MAGWLPNCRLQHVYRWTEIPLIEIPINKNRWPGGRAAERYQRFCVWAVSMLFSPQRLPRKNDLQIGLRIASWLPSSPGARRFFELSREIPHGPMMPNMVQAGQYSSTVHYLRAVEAAGTDEAAAVMARMRSTPINDFFVKNGRIREDGRMVTTCTCSRSRSLPSPRVRGIIAAS
jgi:Periplasmic binding protein